LRVTPVPCATKLFSRRPFAGPPWLSRPSGRGGHLRAKARNRGNLQSKSQPIVTITSYAVIQAANAQITDVPAYAPAAICGLRPPNYPYLPAYYTSGCAVVAASPIWARPSLWVRCGRADAAGVGMPGWGGRTVIFKKECIRNHPFNKFNVNKNDDCQHGPTLDGHGCGCCSYPVTTCLLSHGLSAGKSERL
jgi:uncharacterized protein DUF3300